MATAKESNLINASEYKQLYREPKMTQTQCLIDYLEHYGTITPLEALIAFGCLRLPARVFDAKHKYGYDIVTDRASEKYAIYSFRNKE